MKPTQAKKTAATWQPKLSEAAYLHAAPVAMLAVDRDFSIVFSNQAASAFILSDAEKTLIARVFENGETISAYEHAMGEAVVNLHIAPVLDEEKNISQAVITIDMLQGRNRLAVSEWKREATHAAGVMAAMLAHEVKNPLSGIRGAAQLLKEEIASEHQPLAELICMETDRIRDLLSQVEIFSDRSPDEMQPVNIHEVLHYVLSLASAGFAPHACFEERYDPSLPDVMGKRDLLVQLFLNLLKNAAEATSEKKDAVITITTSYQSGYRMNNTPLPVVVSIADNGLGIADDMRTHLFEPFVSSKDDGRGLGLAVVAKIASDLGMMVELDEKYHPGAKFNVMMAVTSRS